MLREEEPALAPRPRLAAEVPLALAQERLWFLSRLDPADASLNLFLVYRLRGALDAASLERALREVVHRHEILRTRYPSTADGRPVQVVEPGWRSGLERIDLAPRTADERERIAVQLVAERVNAPFDLAERPPLRAALLRLDERQHVLCLVLHYIAADGWSVAVLWQELAALYAAFAAGEPSPLPPLPVQYGDYALWQHEGLTPEATEAHLAYWRDRLAGAPALDLPTDRPRAAVRSSNGDAVIRRVPLGPAVDRLARGRRCTPFIVLMAAFQALLGYAAGQDDVCVGSPAAGRDELELEPLIGAFMRTLVLRGDLSGDPSFAELVTRTRARALEAYAHQDVPFERLLTALCIRRDPGQTPLFQAMLALENPDAGGPRLPGLEVEAFEASYRQARLDLSLEVWRDGPDLVCIFAYASDLFEAATIDRMAAGFEALLAVATAEPHRPISTVFARALPQQERVRLLTAWSDGPAGHAGDGALPDLAAGRPDAVALGTAGEDVTYGELRRRVGGLARVLRRRGVGPETTVAVLAERSPELVVALLAVLAAGGAYVPLDPSHPGARIAAVLRASGAGLVLAHERLARLLPEDAPVLSLDRPPAGGDLPPPAAHPANLACVLFTSGSTGAPKGVAITRGALTSRVRWMREHYGLTARDRVLQLAAPTFDTHAEEILPALAAGATLVLGPHPGELADFLDTPRGRALTVLDLSTPHWHALIGETRWPPELRLLVLGADRVRADALAAWHERVGNRAAVVNTYGPTEATIIATAAPLTPADPAPRPPIGRPIADTSAYVLDRWLEPVATGVPGELCLAGAGLARGYLGRPDLTAARFVPHPHGPPGARLYRTGDRARWRAGGQLDFLGRLDDQVKIRGQRVEPGEIEAALLTHPAVGQAAVVAHGDGDRRLVAYVAPATAPQPSELRRHLAARLPEAMIPAAYVALDRLPLTPGGKLDRRALPEPGIAAAPGQAYVAPRTLAEELVAATWAEVLGRDRIGALDDFFALGGHSLLATRVVARLRSAVDVDVPLRTVFAARTAAELAEAIERLLAAEIRSAAATSIPRHTGPPPLSFAQERLWFMEQLAPGTAAYSIPLSLRLRGRLDPERLEAALTAVVARHEALRARFRTTDDGRPALDIAPPAPVGLRRVRSDERGAAELLSAEAARPFDLERGPLLRATLVRLGEDDHALLVAVHHIVSDGWSADVLLGELLALMAGEPLPDLPLRYGDHAAWQRGQLDGPAATAELAYWRERLAGLPALELPADRPRPAEMGFAGAGHRFRLDRELSESVARLAAAHGATLYMTLLAAFQALLGRWSGQHDFAVGSPVAGRSRPELEPLLGLFVNMLTLRADLTGDPGFGELLRRARETALDAFAHQELPFERIVQAVEVARDVGRTPLFQAVFALQNYAHRPPDPPGLAVTGFPLETAAARFDLELFCWETDIGLEGVLTYRTDLFDRSTIERLTAGFETLLRAAVARPETRVSELPLLAPADRALVLDAWQRTEAPAPGPRGLHELIDAAAAATPGAPAVAAGERQLTYAELDRAANRLARRLRRMGVGPEARVGVCLEPSIEAIVAVLGVLRAGGAFVPLDPEQPPERLLGLLADAGARVLVTDAAGSRRLGPAAPPAICVDADRDAIAAERGDPTGAGIRPDNLAYVIYTSGSTGRPKGVAVQHHEAVTYLAGVRARFGAAPGATFGMAQSLAFDFGLTMLLLALATGGCLRLLPRRLDGVELAAHLERWPLDVLKLTPSHLAALLAEVEPRALLPRRLLVLGGEASRLAWARELAGAGDCAVVNHYGPTETTVGVTTFAVTAAGPAAGTTPIGRPLPHARVHVLDGRLEPVPPGVVGEVCVGGERLARGYLRQPGPTAERFVPDPHGPPGARLYRTGDLGRWLPGGDLAFLGREDQQAKVRGHRVEPGEVEAALGRCPGIGQAAVDVRDGQLIAYLVTGRDQPPTGDIRRRLRRELPDYLVPSRFVWLDRLPLKAHGKVDRTALPEPPAESTAEAAFAPPDGPIEGAIADAWAAVLGVPRVGALDDFFALGGHSLLAMQAVARLRRTLPEGSRPVSVMDLFKHPTVRGLAELVRAPAPIGPRRLLHELTPPVAGRPRLTLVCVPYGGGSAVVYQPLADALPAGCALHALAIPGHDPGLAEERQPLDEVARRCVEEIVTHTEGPVVLYGHCGVGGALTADIARRLEAAGRPPAAIYMGGIFPFARPRGHVLGRMADAAAAEWLHGDRAHANWLRSMGSDVADLGPEERRRTIRNMRDDTRAAERWFTDRLDEGLPPLAAPVISVVGERDPSTDYHQERYREWRFLARSAALVVLAEGGHYFLKHRAAELAEIVTRTHTALAEQRIAELPSAGAGATWWLGGTADGAQDDPVAPSMRRFLAIAASQLVSITGSAVTEFAVPLWIYLTTGSLVQFAAFAVAGLVPGILAAPVAGAIVDRSDRRRIMLAGDCAAGLALAIMALLLWTGRLQAWEIYGLVACLSVALTFQRLAYNSAVPQLVPKRYLGHANGVLQLTGGMAQFVVPLVAVGLVASVGLGGVLALDVASYAVSVAAVLAVRFPAAMAHRRRESLWAEILGGFRYSLGRRGFRAMLGFFALLNVFLAPLLMLMTPLLLSFTTLAAVAPVSVAGAAGATLGGLIMAVWGGPSRRRMRAVLVATCGLAACCAVTGVRPWAVLVGLGWFGSMLCLSIVNGVYATIIQVKVPQRFHGRVIALNTLVAWSTLPLGFGVVAPLGAHLAEPLMARGGALAGSAGAVLGVGPGRGIGLLYVAFGLLMAAVALGGLGLRSLARFDDEVPDAVADDVVGVEALRARRAGTRADR